MSWPMRDESPKPLDAGICPARSQSGFLNMSVIEGLQGIFLLTTLSSFNILLNANNRGDLYQDLSVLNNNWNTVWIKLKLITV